MLNKSLKLNKDIFDRVKLKKIATRDGYGEGLIELGEKNRDVVVLTGDLAESTRCEEFEEKFPERFFEVGVAEQNMMSIAAGLALSGKIPFVSSFGVFCPGRCWDQLRISVAYSEANVKFVGAHAGITVGPDGASHQALEDIASVRCIPNITVVVPCDAIETKKAVIAAVNVKGPVYLRFGRPKTSVFTSDKTPFEIGRAQVYREGKDVVVIGCGPLLHEALLAANDLEKEGIDVSVINNHTIKPIDEKMLVDVAKRCGAVVTVEDHQIMGGMGSAVSEVLAVNFPVPIEMVGVSDKFGESGQPNELLKKYMMTKEDIIMAIKKVIKRK